jgi:hypothetical protein
MLADICGDDAIAGAMKGKADGAADTACAAGDQSEPGHEETPFGAIGRIAVASE